MIFYLRNVDVFSSYFRCVCKLTVLYFSIAVTLIRCGFLLSLKVSIIMRGAINLMNIPLVVGLSIFSTLLTAKKLKPTNNKPIFISLPGKFKVISSTNGRMRINLPLLKANKILAVPFVNQLASLSPIKKVECNLKLGTLLVEYNEGEMNASLLQGIVIKLLGLDTAMLNKEAPSHIITGLKNGVKSVNYGVSCATGGYINLYDLLTLGLIGIGAYKIYKAPKILPNGYTLVRWAFGFI